jgi:hypothetical protein
LRYRHQDKDRNPERIYVVTNHELTVTFDQNGRLMLATGFPLVHEPDKDGLVRLHTRTGDTIRWTSPHGKVKIRFTDGNSPFVGAAMEIDGDGSHEVKNAGSFSYQCALTLWSGKLHGWLEGSGGAVDVEIGTSRVNK